MLLQMNKWIWFFFASRFYLKRQKNMRRIKRFCEFFSKNFLQKKYFLLPGENLAWPVFLLNSTPVSNQVQVHGKKKGLARYKSLFIQHVYACEPHYLCLVLFLLEMSSTEQKNGRKIKMQQQRKKDTFMRTYIKSMFCLKKNKKPFFVFFKR